MRIGTLKVTLAACGTIMLCGLILNAVWQRGAAAESNEIADKATSSSSTAEDASEKLAYREGEELIKVEGYFSIVNGRAQFSPTGKKATLTVLENKLLERIVQITNQQAGQVVWIITGTTTEYNSANYLILTHAVRKRGQHRASKSNNN